MNHSMWQNVWRSSQKKKSYMTNEREPVGSRSSNNPEIVVSIKLDRSALALTVNNFLPTTPVKCDVLIDKDWI